MKKLVGALFAAFGLAVAGPSAAIVVGGIDFGALGNTAHLEAETLAETVVNAPGQKLQGYGQVTQVNGTSAYCSPSPCTLYYYFHDYTVTKFNGSQVEFSGGVVDIYYSAAPPINFLSNNSPTNVGLITGMTLWAELSGHTFLDPIFNATVGSPLDTYTLNGNGVLTGSSLSENGEGLLDTTAFGEAAVLAYLNSNGAGDGLGGFADIALTSSSNNLVVNPNDVCDATPLAGQWCLQGTLNTRGKANVPEPATLALLGIGLVGLGFARRRKSA